MANILIVEDEKVVAWDIQEALEKLGHTVIASVTSGAEAVQCAGTIQPDVILMDIRLDGHLDGIEAARQINACFNIPVIYLTAHADDYTLNRAIETNPFGYLVKPFQNRELHTTIEIALRRHQLERRSDQTTQQLTYTLASIESALIATDRRGCITFINPAAEVLTGWQRHEAIAQPIAHVLSLIDSRTRQPLENPLLQTMERGTILSCQSQGCILLAKDGTETPIEDYTKLLQTPEGEIFGSVIVFNKRTQSQLPQTTCSHDIEQPPQLDFSIQPIFPSLNLEEILTTTVTEVRHVLEADRVILYQFKANDRAVVVAESLAAGGQSMLGWQVYDPWLVEKNAFCPYQHGQIQIIEDIYMAKLEPEYRQLMEYFEIRAKIATPLLYQGQLWGVLACHYCRFPRQWKLQEIRWLKSFTRQVGIAIEQAQLCQALHTLAFVDGLTQVANRRRFDTYLQQQWQQLEREEMPLSVIMSDIDYFKAYNDTYGHQAGDNCLRLVAHAIEDAVKRPTDLVARYGGEEFGVILPNSNVARGIEVAQRILRTVKQLQIKHAGSRVDRYVTLSLGVASGVPRVGTSPLALVAAADRALYQAKAQGRDRVVLGQYRHERQCFEGFCLRHLETG